MKRLTKIDPRVSIRKIIQPVIIRVNKFTEESVKEFEVEMEKAYSTGQSFIPIVIDSYGGEAYSLIEIMEQINTAILPIITVVEGKAMSCGSLLFAMGHQRYMSKNATLMFHEISSGFIGKNEDMKVSSRESERINKLVFQLASKNIGKNKNHLLEVIHGKKNTDWYLTASEAKKHNICTQIGVPVIHTELTVNYNLLI